MNNYICIDGGTTNTRITAVIEGKIIDKETLAIGCKDNIASNRLFKEKIKKGINNIISKNGIDKNDITAILASGMITSEHGLTKVPHIAAPVGIKELHSGLVKVFINEICDIPFYFIPGIIFKNGELETDMMRGEETEALGLLDNYSSDCAFLLPGSHSKLITFDNNGLFEKIKTFLSGEMIYAIANDTILKSSINIMQNDFDSEYLIKGFEAAKCGLNQALFKIRILDSVYNAGPISCYSFFIGAILADEITALENCGRKKVVIGGKNALKNPICFLLNEITDLTVISVPNELAENSTALGAIKIFEFDQA